jgi:hypothetical protein
VPLNGRLLREAGKLWQTVIRTQPSKTQRFRRVLDGPYIMTRSPSPTSWSKVNSVEEVVCQPYVIHLQQL